MKSQEALPFVFYSHPSFQNIIIACLLLFGKFPDLRTRIGDHHPEGYAICIQFRGKIDRVIDRFNGFIGVTENKKNLVFIPNFLDRATALSASSSFMFFPVFWRIFWFPDSTPKANAVASGLFHFNQQILCNDIHSRLCVPHGLGRNPLFSYVQGVHRSILYLPRMSRP